MPHATVPLTHSDILPEDAYAAASADAHAVVRFETMVAVHCSRRHAIAASSGQAAMWAALASLGLRAGDEVICSALVPSSTLLAVLALGAKVVFVDVSLKQLVADAAAVEAAFTARTRAIVVAVAVAGQAGVEAVAASARRLEIPLLEDGGQGFGSSIAGRALGSIGRASVFDFGPGAPLSTLGGGVLVTDDDALANAARKILHHPDGAGLPALGTVMHPFAAALGQMQLQRLPEILQQRRTIAECYLCHLIDNPDLALPDLQGQKLHAWPVLWARLATDYRFEQVTGILRYLNRHDIEAVPALRCAHKLALPTGAAGKNAGLSVAESLARRTLRLPIFNRMTENQVEQVCHTLTAAMLEARRHLEDWPEGGGIALDD